MIMKLSTIGNTRVAQSGAKLRGFESSSASLNSPWRIKQEGINDKRMCQFFQMFKLELLHLTVSRI